ncbi:MAG: DNA polymerase III subunit delta [Bacteroidota bacterium]
MLVIFGGMQFREVPGQYEIKSRLIQAVRANRVSHALLFSGSAGTGNYAIALAFAQFLQCKNPTEEDSCGRCASCHQAAGMVHPDIHYVFPVARTIKNPGEPISEDLLEEWREYISGNPFPEMNDWFSAMKIENKQAGIFKREAEEILRKLSFKSYQSDYKIVIVWLPEKMNPSAANKLLKIIEEPADHTVFLFVSENTDDILPTILSRTQLIKVPGISVVDLHDKLLVDFPERESELESVAKRSGGDYLIARDMIGLSEAAQVNRDRFIQWMRISFALKIEDIISWVDEITEIGRERQKLFLSYSLEMLRENFLFNQGLKELVTFDPVEAEFAVKFSRFIHPGNITGLMKEFNVSIAQIGMNANPKILFTDMSLQLNRLLRIPAAG